MHDLQISLLIKWKNMNLTPEISPRRTAVCMRLLVASNTSHNILITVILMSASLTAASCVGATSAVTVSASVNVASAQQKKTLSGNFEILLAF